MCFSAEASFALAGVLLPAGLYSVAAARRAGSQWLPLAGFPLAFSVQQAAEGFVWIGLESGNQLTVATAARGFLFFSHLFWMTYVPFSVWWLEEKGWRKSAFALLTWIGAIYGLSIFLPPAFMAGGLVVERIVHSLEYHVVEIHDAYVDPRVLRLIYAGILLAALLGSRETAVKLFGLLILASMLITIYVFPYAFISVWCFFAAVVSLYIVALMALKSRSVRAAARDSGVIGQGREGT